MQRELCATCCEFSPLVRALQRIHVELHAFEGVMYSLVVCMRAGVVPLQVLVQPSPVVMCERTSKRCVKGTGRRCVE